MWEHVVLSCLEYDSTRRPLSPSAVIDALRGKHFDRKQLFGRRELLITSTAALFIVGVARFYPRSHRPNPQAYYHLKRGLEFSHQTSPEGIRNAIAEIKQAVTIDPEFADGWANLADIYCMASTYSAIKPTTARSLAEDAALRALSLDYSIGKAHSAYAHARASKLKGWRSAESSFKEALRLDPKDPSSRSWYAAFLGRMSRFDEAVAMAESALQLDPGSFPLNYQLGTELLRAKRFDRCLSHLLDLVRLHPAEGAAFCLLARTFEWLKRFSEARDALHHADQLPDRVVSLAYWATLFAASGSTTDAIKSAERIRRNWAAEATETNVVLTVLGALAMALGERSQSNEVVTTMKEGIRREDETVLAAAANPYMQVMRTDPGVLVILNQLDLA